MLIGSCGGGEGGAVSLDDSGGLEELTGEELVVGCGVRGGDTVGELVVGCGGRGGDTAGVANTCEMVEMSEFVADVGSKDGW